MLLMLSPFIIYRDSPKTSPSSLFSKILLFLFQFCLLAGHLSLLLLHLLLLHLLESLHTSHQAIGFLWVVLVLLVTLLQDSEEFLVVCGLAKCPHDSGTEEQ